VKKAVALNEGKGNSHFRKVKSEQIKKRLFFVALDEEDNTYKAYNECCWECNRGEFRY
jgi:hypothetical protein